MTLTISSNVKKIWPRLTEAQKNARREKFIALMNDVQQARAIYSNKVQAISKKHRQCVLFHSAVERPTSSLPFFRLTVSFLICATSILT